MIRVVEPGLLTTVQDLGRAGQAALGVSACGAADPLSLRAANLLVGNPPGAAALEMTLVGGAFAFEDDARIAVAGSDFGIPPGSVRSLRAGEVLRFGATCSGARGYLAVGGGIDVPPLLGSRATHLPSGLGGFHGRALRQDDRVPVGRGETRAPRPVPVREIEAWIHRRTLRVLPGIHAASFTAASLRSLEADTWTIGESSDRSGLRLAGPALARHRPGPILTEGMLPGAIQVPDGGAPIVLGVDQATTGGYPVIAHVIAADLAALGQLRPRDRIRLRVVRPDEAHAALLAREALLE